MSKAVGFTVVALLAAVLMFSSILSAFADSDARFSLSDAQAEKGRTFEVTLRADIDAEISAFVCELSYDSQVLKFNSAEVLGKDVQHSVNTLEDGKVTAVYLCEEGIPCMNDTALMTFTFKALEKDKTQIKLSVKDAITSDLYDVEVYECVSSEVTISGASLRSIKDKTATAGNADTQNVASADENKISFIKGRTDIAGFSVSNQTLVSLMLSFVCTMCVAVYVAYKLGVRKQSKIQKGAPLEYKDINKREVE